MPSRKERTMFAYSMHARGAGGVLDYPDVFRSLNRVPATTRQTSVGDEVVGLTSMAERESGWVLRFVAGEDALALFYDPRTGEEGQTDLGGRLVAHANWVYVNPETRIVAIERRRPGVGVAVIARALGHMVSELGIVEGPARFDFNPVAGTSLGAEIRRYERIRQASVVLARPNFNWSDNSQRLTDYADDSNADGVEISMSAERGESLTKDNGIVADILDATKKILGPVKNLRITGRRTGEKKESSVSLKRHQQKRSYEVPGTQDLQAEQESFGSSAEEFVSHITDGEAPPDE